MFKSEPTDRQTDINEVTSLDAADANNSVHTKFLRNHSSIKLKPPGAGGVGGSFDNTSGKRRGKRSNSSKSRRGLFYYERKLFKFSKRERIWLLFGTLAQMVYGSILPAISLVFSEIFYIFALPDERTQRSLALKYMGIILGIAVINLVTTILQSYAFALAGAKLTKRLRVKMFESMLRQEVAFHDLDENRSSILSTKLSTSAPLCKVS